MQPQNIFARGTSQLSTTLPAAPGHLVALTCPRPPLPPGAAGPGHYPRGRDEEGGEWFLGGGGEGKDVRPEGEARQPPACGDLVTVTSKAKLHSPRPLPSSARRLQSRGARLHPARRGSVQATNTRSGRQTQAPQPGAQRPSASG